MTTRRLHIVWPNDQTVTVYLENNPAADYYYDCMKHLQHIPLTFNQRSNSLLKQNIKDLENELVNVGSNLGIKVNPAKIREQQYLNFLHDIYFQHVNKNVFDKQWLKFHDIIHIIETYDINRPRHTQIWFDYKENAGPLTTSFDRTWLKYSVNELKSGDCFFQAHELGKNLLTYKNDNEPLDINLMKNLAKPWLTTRPLLNLELTNRIAGQHFFESGQEEFTQWFTPYREEWCKHWKIPDWQPWEMFAKIPVGTIKDLSTINENFSQGYYPTHIKIKQ